MTRVAQDRGLQATQFYDAHARALADGYEAVAFADAHPFLETHLAGAPKAQVLDIGAGTGRDAAAVAALGHDVTAIDPSSNMLTLGRRLHRSKRIRWQQDALPDLSTLPPGARFDLIILSAVWMHVAPEDREPAAARLIECLAPGGLIYATLRQGPADPSRAMFRTSAAEFQRIAKGFGLRFRDLGTDLDLLGRPDISWRSVVLERTIAGLMSVQSS